MHWRHPETRGIYQHPGTQPPPPQPNESNNLTSRVVRIETYLSHALHDRIRAEQDSLRRDYDISDRLTSIETQMTEWSQQMRAIILIARWGMAGSKYLLAVVLLALWINGALTWDGVRPYLSALGFPVP